MIFDVDETIRKRAKTPHELSMLNLVGCHLIAAPASIVLDVGLLGFLIPLAFAERHGRLKAEAVSPR
ncbi:MAG: hypothetical protein KZQ72_16180 [Candidatus Thiodiazotropha sp. (ex Cardiolucina cf. quadrata)]|nr:hypothetical protein [Candidatus Thiodiazotropha sp. (ex Cardiolucina cf. quadrata)]